MQITDVRHACQAAAMTFGTRGVGLGERQARFGRAWLGLTIVVALHVLDEALTDFLSVYNPIVREAQVRWTWFPMPEFTFSVWLPGLCLVVAILFVVTPFAFRGARPIRLVAYPYAVIMLLNGMGHLGGSIYLGQWAPGATTAPLLLVSSTFLLYSVRKLSGR